MKVIGWLYWFAFARWRLLWALDRANVSALRRIVLAPPGTWCINHTACAGQDGTERHCFLGHAWGSRVNDGREHQEAMPVPYSVGLTFDNAADMLGLRTVTDFLQDEAGKRLRAGGRVMV